MWFVQSLFNLCLTELNPQAGSFFMAERDTHIYADYGELMECLLLQRSRFASEAAFENFALAAVQRFLLDLRHLGIQTRGNRAHLLHLPAAHSSTDKLGN